MKAIVATFAVVLATFLVLDTGSAIKCFLCNSYHQHDCADWFDNVTQHLTQCAPDEHLCRKVIQEAKFNGEYHVRYLRQCGKAGVVGADEGRICTVKYGTNAVKMTYCHCSNQDGCNSSDALLSSFTSAIFASLVTLFQFVFPRL